MEPASYGDFTMNQRNRIGAHKRRMLGRGIGLHQGKTGGRGVKVQGPYRRRMQGFEGGQMPIHRLPKRGFRNLFARNSRR